MILTDEDDLSDYTKFIQNSSSTSFMQSPNWAKVKKNWKNFYVLVKEKDTIVIAMSVLIQTLPKINKSIMYAPRRTCWQSR